jgi:hypothetical protein
MLHGKLTGDDQGYLSQSVLGIPSPDYLKSLEEPGFQGFCLIIPNNYYKL